MTTPIDATAGAGAAANVQKFANPTAASFDPKLEMSDMAQKMLERLGNLQKDFAVNRSTHAGLQPLDAARAIQSETAMVGSTSVVPPPTMAESMIQLTNQTDNAMSVQNQLLKFTMASSISSSMGKDLNMFLRGQ